MSWEAESWASNGGSYSDTLIAPSTIEQPYDDYSGRAVFYKSASDDAAVQIDLFINHLEYSVSEHMKFEEMVGNMFDYVAFGKDAMRVTLSGFLVDTGKNYGKDSLVDFYRNYLRMEAVARRGVTPILCFPDAAFYCAASSMEISETSDSEDLLTVTMALEITAAVFTSTEDSFMLDYMHGAEISKDSILNTELTTASDTSALSTNVTLVESSSKNTASAATSTETTSPSTTSGITFADL